MKIKPKEKVSFVFFFFFLPFFLFFFSFLSLSFFFLFLFLLLFLFSFFLSLFYQNNKQNFKMLEGKLHNVHELKIHSEFCFLKLITIGLHNFVFSLWSRNRNILFIVCSLVVLITYRHLLPLLTTWLSGT